MSKHDKKTSRGAGAEWAPKQTGRSKPGARKAADHPAGAAKKSGRPEQRSGRPGSGRPSSERPAGGRSGAGQNEKRHAGAGARSERSAGGDEFRAGHRDGKPAQQRKRGPATAESGRHAEGRDRRAGAGGRGERSGHAEQRQNRPNVARRPQRPGGHGVLPEGGRPIDSLADLIQPLDADDGQATSQQAKNTATDPSQPAAVMAGYRAGLVALAGRPNVGKSSLVNRLVGQKVSIVTHKAQTTRHRIAGVASFPQGQLVLLDTPGIHRQAGRALNRQMNRTAEKTLADADAVLMVVEAGRWTQEDQDVLKRVLSVGRPCFAVVNKVDRLNNKEALLPFVQEHFSDPLFKSVFMVSARTGVGLERMIAELIQTVPESEPLYPLDQISDRPVRFLCAELIREQLMERLHEELPYGLTVTVEQWEDQGHAVSIHAAIWVSRESHKGMVIGRSGQVLKQVGTAARQEMEQLIGQRVMLHLWVRVREDWSNDDQALGQFGYVEE